VRRLVPVPLIRCFEELPLINQHRSFAVLAATLSAQLALVVCSTTASISTARAATVPVNGDVGMTASNYSVAESAGSVTLAAQRTGGTHGALSVSYTTVGGTAVSGKQFTPETGTLTWADGDGANKSFKIPVLNSTPFTGTKWFAVRLTAGTGTILGSHTSAYINIVGGTPVVTKSIRQWVSCDETIDESSQVEQALLLAANHAFTLIIDCPVRLHTGTASERSIAVPDGVTIAFQGAGEFLAVGNGPPALTVAHPSEVTFLDWNYTYL